MRLLLATDAWTPQVNGVVVSLRNTPQCLRKAGHEAALIEPGQFRSIPCPTYPEIRLALRPARLVSATIEAFAPDAIHIATEGPPGLAARRYCLRNGRPFTTAYRNLPGTKVLWHSEQSAMVGGIRRTRKPASAAA